MCVYVTVDISDRYTTELFILFEVTNDNKPTADENHSQYVDSHLSCAGGKMPEQL